MASLPPGPPPGPGGPGGMPSPGPGPGGPGMGPGVMSGPGGPGGPQGSAGPPPPQEMFKAVMAMGQQIDTALKSFAQAMPEGAELFAEAADLIKKGIAQALGGSGAAEPPTASPTATGSEFPGGGFSSGSRV